MAEKLDSVQISAGKPASFETVIATLRRLDNLITIAAGRKLGNDVTVVVTNFLMGVEATAWAADAAVATKVVSDLMRDPIATADAIGNDRAQPLAAAAAKLLLPLMAGGGSVDVSGYCGQVHMTMARVDAIAGIAAGKSTRRHMVATEQGWSPILRVGKTTDDGKETVRISWDGGEHDVLLDAAARATALNCLEHNQWADIRMDAAYRVYGIGKIEFDAGRSRLVGLTPLERNPGPLAIWDPPFVLSHQEIAQMIMEIDG